MAKLVTATCDWQPANTHITQQDRLFSVKIPNPVKATVLLQHSAGRMNGSSTLRFSLGFWSTEPYSLFARTHKHLVPIGLLDGFSPSHHLLMACQHGQRWTRNTRCGSGMWWIWVCGYSLFAWVGSEIWANNWDGEGVGCWARIFKLEKSKKYWHQANRYRCAQIHTHTHTLKLEMLN